MGLLTDMRPRLQALNFVNVALRACQFVFAITAIGLYASALTHKYVEVYQHYRVSQALPD